MYESFHLYLIKHIVSYRVTEIRPNEINLKQRSVKVDFCAGPILHVSIRNNVLSISAGLIRVIQEFESLTIR